MCVHSAHIWAPWSKSLMCHPTSLLEIEMIDGPNPFREHGRFHGCVHGYMDSWGHVSKGRHILGYKPYHTRAPAERWAIATELCLRHGNTQCQCNVSRDYFPNCRPGVDKENCRQQRGLSQAAVKTYCSQSCCRMGPASTSASPLRRAATTLSTRMRFPSAAA